MTDCPQCNASVAPGVLICLGCGANLGSGGTPHPPVTQEVAAEAGFTCDNCGAANPAGKPPFCVRCLAPRVSRPAVPGPATACRQPARLVFDIGIEVSLEPGTEIVLGRDPVRSPVGVPLGPYDTVSRIHATVGSDPAGDSWVRDEGSTNHTFVNGRPVPPKETVRLRLGDELRLASTVKARLQAG